MNILFVCKYNRYRSKVAAAFFNKMSSSKHKAKSVGIIRGNLMSPSVKACAKEYNLSIRGSPKPIDVPLLRWQDMIVIVADDVPASIFSESRKYGKKVVVWKIPDTADDNKAGIQDGIEKIQKRVRNLVKSL
jgi:protein-tyrosine-phosphatase